eukprot:scaffold3826_cov407-Prasinococcus_capsulatus_cf.AAC.3
MWRPPPARPQLNVSRLSSQTSRFSATLGQARRGCREVAEHGLSCVCRHRGRRWLRRHCCCDGRVRQWLGVKPYKSVRAGCDAVMMGEKGEYVCGQQRGVHRHSVQWFMLPEDHRIWRPPHCRNGQRRPEATGGWSTTFSSDQRMSGPGDVEHDNGAVRMSCEGNQSVQRLCAGN